MGAYSEVGQEPGKTARPQDTIYDVDEWQRWDKEMVEDFGRWLSRIVKTFAILILVGSAVIVIGWFWKAF
ncbi:MAG: hypothetical protein V3W17_08965 [Desulfobacteria bacterium]